MAPLIDDDQRLVDLFALDLIDDVRNATFDRIARIASLTFDVPVSLVTMLDEDNQFFCGVHGTDLTGTPREESFCNHTVRRDEVLVVPDALDDLRFRHLPLVVDAPHLRFYAGAPVSAPGGKYIGALCILDVQPRDLDARQRSVLRDLADLVEAELEHHGRALTDSMTQLPNRRAFMSAAARFVSLGQRHGEPVSMIFADINGLKRVNDELGHGAGDVLIKRAATCINESIRRADVAARIGGDEFAVLLYGTDEDDARRVIDAIEARITEDNRLTRPQGADPSSALDASSLSVAFGASTARVGQTLGAFVSCADSAMYDAKRATAAASCTA